MTATSAPLRGPALWPRPASRRGLAVELLLAALISALFLAVLLLAGQIGANRQCRELHHTDPTSYAATCQEAHP